MGLSPIIQLLSIYIFYLKIQTYPVYVVIYIDYNATSFYPCSSYHISSSKALVCDLIVFHFYGSILYLYIDYLKLIHLHKTIIL